MPIIKQDILINNRRVMAYLIRMSVFVRIGRFIEGFSGLEFVSIGLF
jgi:hypothetical protein